ncbi:hypothetical protein HMPREF9413_2114 [Paenibacillus sp. HGF7]|nr:hypothetical protein HMPREF9413_2114 [Paenibacillus sp. HGF7]
MGRRILAHSRPANYMRVPLRTARLAICTKKKTGARGSGLFITYV